MQKDKILIIQSSFKIYEKKLLSKSIANIRNYVYFVTIFLTPESYVNAYICATKNSEQKYSYILEWYNNLDIRSQITNYFNEKYEFHLELSKQKKSN